jgi:serine/threonine protein kinase
LSRIERFALPAGQLLAGKYVVEEKLGGGWEGEVYRVRERPTGIRRAMKLFFPQRNRGNATVRRYAKMLERLRGVHIVIQYLHTETIDFQSRRVTCLISELVEGRPLGEFIRRRPGGRLQPFEALCLAHELAGGLEGIHMARGYHGDLHDGNVLVRRQGIYFRPRVFDFYNHGRTKRSYMQMDVLDVIRLVYDAVGGKRHYQSQPETIKNLCCGLRNDLVRRRFPTATHLRRYLETFSWD